MPPHPLLLLAAFGDGERAIAAWSEWSRGRDLGALDATELRLLPPVYRTLRDGGVADPAIPAAVKQMARSMFIRTRLLLRDASATMALLASHGVAPILLKGAALVAGGYVDAAARPMSDFDVLVRAEEAAAIASILEEAGWRADPPLDAAAIAVRHAAVFKRGESACDLHWWALWESRESGADETFRRGAETATLDGVPVRILRPEHQLLQVAVHGTRAFDVPAVRWIGDALAILRARGGTFDWALFAEEAEARRLTYPAANALAYLGETFGADVPSDVVARLRAHRVPRRQRRLYDARASRKPLFYGVALWSVWLDHRKRTGFLWLPRNVQHVLGAARFRHVPAAIARRLFRRR